MNLFQVSAPHFTAGFTVDSKGDVWAAAPILKWMKEKPLTFIRLYCQKKGWELTQVENENV